MEFSLNYYHEEKAIGREHETIEGCKEFKKKIIEKSRFNNLWTENQEIN